MCDLAREVVFGSTGISEGDLMKRRPYLEFSL